LINFFSAIGEPLLYLLEMPETNGQVKCEAIEKINPLKLNVSELNIIIDNLFAFIDYKCSFIL